MTSRAIEIHLPGFDEGYVVRSGESLALPDVFTMQYAGILITSRNQWNPGVRLLSIGAAATEEHTQESYDTEEQDRAFHNRPERAVPALSRES
jgi:hypothetical protein